MAARLPRTMTPLGLVLFGESVSGSFSVGALLVGCHAAGDVLAAPWVGRHLTVRAALLGEAGALALLVTAGVWTDLAPVVLAGLGALAGAASAGVPGEQRAQLAGLTPSPLHAAAFSLESTASALLYAIGPAAVGVLAASTPALALMVAAAIACLGGVSAAAPGRSEGAPPESPSVARVLRLGWPSYLGAAGFMLAVTVLDVALPARLTELGHDARSAGLLLGAFALTGTVGGLVYGSRSWPGSPSRQALVLVLGLCGLLSCLPLLAHPWAIAGLLLVAGLLGPPALIARSLALQARLPRDAAATGFSGLSAAAGLGTSTAGLLAAPLLHAADAPTTLASALALTTVAALVSARHENPPAASERP